MKRLDVGFVWGGAMHIWGQIGAIFGVANTAMLVGVFYTTTVVHIFPIPAWLYGLIVLAGVVGVVAFCLKVGIKGYYDFFNKNSALDGISAKLDALQTEVTELREQLAKEVK